MGSIGIQQIGPPIHYRRYGKFLVYLVKEIGKNLVRVPLPLDSARNGQTQGFKPRAWICRSGRDMRSILVKTQNRQICIVEQGQAKEKLVQAKFGRASTDFLLPRPFNVARSSQTRRGFGSWQSRRIAMPLASVVTPRTASQDTAQMYCVLEPIFMQSWSACRFKCRGPAFPTDSEIIRLTCRWQLRFKPFSVPRIKIVTP